MSTLTDTTYRLTGVREHADEGGITEREAIRLWSEREYSLIHGRLHGRQRLVGEQTGRVYRVSEVVRGDFRIQPEVT